ncbi:MAG: DUF3313 family protein [Candidatus Binatia bacterium]
MTCLPPTTERLSTRLTVLLAGALLAASVSGCAAGPRPRPQEWDGLTRRTSPTLDYLYVRPNVQFKSYKSVRLDPVGVVFDKNWDPDSPATASPLGKDDIQRIREELATEFRKVLSDRLGRGGYPLVDADGDDVLRVHADLINVYITAPGRMEPGRSRTFVMDAGHLTLFMELRDSVTGQLLARVVDTKQAASTGRLQWANSVTNSAEARRVFGDWADRLRRALDEVNGKGAAK